MNNARKIGLGFVFAWFFVGGISHFLMTDYFVSIVPSYIPNPLAMVYLSAVFEILGALGLLLPTTRRLAGLGLFFLTLVLTQVHVYMWQRPELFPDFPEWALSARLVLQAMLLACIWWSTKPISK